MKRLLFAGVLALAAAGPACASYAPIKHAMSREAVASACAVLGAHGESYGLEVQSGAYGCRNTETGGAVACEENGQCTDYSADPRWKHIQELLHGSKGQQPILFPA